MAKETGLGANFYLDGYDLSSDTASLSSISKSIDTLPMTGIDKSAQERKAGQLKAGISWTNYFNPTNSHLAISTPPRVDRIATYFHKTTLCAPVACEVCKETNVKSKRDNNGSYLHDVDTLANAWWLDWGLALTAGKRVDTGAVNGTGVDFGDPTPAAYNFGLQAYLQVFAFVGTNITIKLQQSNDNAVGDPYADVTGGGFTVVTAAPNKERIATARNLATKRWLRVVSSGTFTSCTFAVAATINITDMTI